MPALAVVTGASSGLGAEFARQLARRGYDLLLVARGADAMERLAADLRDTTGVTVSVRPVDLADERQRAGLLAELATLDVDLLVNNAGLGAHGRFHELPAARQSEEVLVNVLAVTELARAVSPGMAARRRGGILNVASTSAFQPTPWMAVYGATKAYTRSFGLALSADLRPFGVTVTTLCPGPVATGFAAREGSAHATPGQVLRVEDVVAAGLRGYEKGRRQVVPGLPNVLSTLSSRFAPLAAVLAVGRRVLRPRR